MDNPQWVCPVWTSPLNLRSSCPLTKLSFWHLPSILFCVSVNDNSFHPYFWKQWKLGGIWQPLTELKMHPEYSLEGLMLKVEAPILWPPDAKSQFIRKDPDAGKDWRQEEKGTIEDEMVGWHHRLNGDSDGQGGLACCSPWGLKESDTTEGLNWTELNS